jgi:hypothetical protein
MPLTTDYESVVCGKKARISTENVLLAYFPEKSKNYKFSALWAQYSI